MSISRGRPNTLGVHCHPPKNRASLPVWIEKCAPYLYEELEIVQPQLMIALGEDAESALRRRYPAARSLRWAFQDVPEEVRPTGVHR